jgi:hypothetical protein
VPVQAARQRLLALARARGGVLTADAVEADELLAADPVSTAAAAHELATRPEIETSERSGEQGWFPFEFMRFGSAGER